MSSRRSFLGLATALTASGCATSPALENAYRAFRLQLYGHPDQPISREQVAKIPYATIAGKIGKGPRVILVLSHSDHGDLVWASSDRAVVVTRHGRVVKTAGFPENIRNTQPLTPDPLAQGLHTLNGVMTWHRSIDLDKGSTFGLDIDATFENLGEQRVTIADVDLETVLIRETCRSRLVAWDHTNFYWVDRYDGFVWKSRQHIARTFPPIEIEVLKPFAA